VLFDLDDTLYLERDFVLSGMRAVARWAEQRLGCPWQSTYAELRGLFESGVRGNTFDLWLKGQGLEPTAWGPEMVRVYREHEPEIEPLPGVRELIKSLRPRYSLGLVSDGWAAVQRRKLHALELAPCLDAIVFSDEMGRDCWKPNPAPFCRAMEQLSIRGTDGVYVADNPTKDFRGARAVGLYTVRLRHPRGLYCKLEPEDAEDAPNEEIRAIDELRRFLES
jgi:putative hydrolase of the HAD superfamily